MSIGIIDAREWQTVLDFKTGKKITSDSEMVKMAKRIISKQTFPGDIDKKSIDWTVDIALDLYAEYNPELFFMIFGPPFFYAAFRNLPDNEWQEVVDAVFKNIKRFFEATDYEPVIVGLGDMTTVKGFIDLNSLDGLAVSNNWSLRCAGICEPSRDDLEALQRKQGISAIIKKEEFIMQYQPQKYFIDRLPDYLLTADEGYMFKGFSSASRKFYKIPAINKQIPLHTTLGQVKGITDIRKLIDEALPRKKVAIILIEGIGIRDFQYQYELCDNMADWYTYDQVESQYLAVSTGKHYYKHEVPPVSKYLEADFENKAYPFSGPHHFLPQDTVGRKSGIKSAAVASRGMMPHVASGADICIECFVRNLFNMGTIAIINDEK